MHTYTYERDFEGYKLAATYEYEAADPEVGMSAIYTVVSLFINDSPFDAMELVDPAVVQMLEAEIAKTHDKDSHEPDAYDEWRDEQLMLEAA